MIFTRILICVIALLLVFVPSHVAEESKSILRGSGGLVGVARDLIRGVGGLLRGLRGNGVVGAGSLIHSFDSISGQMSQNRVFNNNGFNWIEQKLDHFDPSDSRKWKMRYIARGEFYVKGGPMFVYIGGENAIEPTSALYGHFFDIARELNGYIFHTEHRFYGDSQPFSHLSTENLKFLTSKQALADLRHFIETMKKTIGGLENCKVILNGGSYSGCLAKWFRQLYPDLADGVWASSAPVLAKMNFFEYNVVAGRAYYQLGGAYCYRRIQNGIRELEKKFSSQPKSAKSMLKLCENFDEMNIYDLGSLFSTIANSFTSAALENLEEIPRNCDFLRQQKDDMIAVVNFFSRSMNSPNCHPCSFRDTTDFLRDTSMNVNSALRAWYYQLCNEFGFYPSSESADQPFGKMFPPSMLEAKCERLFGPKFGKHQTYNNTIRTNGYYGGVQRIQDPRIYVTFGEFDPYSGAGYRAMDGATIIPRSTHCQDLASISPMDSKAMREAKKRISQLIREWIR